MSTWFTYVNLQRFLVVCHALNPNPRKKEKQITLVFLASITKEKRKNLKTPILPQRKESKPFVLILAHIIHQGKFLVLTLFSTILASPNGREQKLWDVLNSGILISWGCSQVQLFFVVMNQFDWPIAKKS
jgi:hypothetical protein